MGRDGTLPGSVNLRGERAGDRPEAVVGRISDRRLHGAGP